MEARPNDYMFDYEGTGDCMLFIMPMNSAMNILGMPVHVDYYTVHEPFTGQVHWAPHAESTKSDIVRTLVSTD